MELCNVGTHYCPISIMVVNVSVVNNVQLLLMRVGTDCLNFFQGRGMGYVELDRRGQGLFHAKNENSGLSWFTFNCLVPQQ